MNSDVPCMERGGSRYDRYKVLLPTAFMRSAKRQRNSKADVQALYFSAGFGDLKKEVISMEVIDMKQNLKESFFRVGSVLLLLCLLLPIVAQADNANESVYINATTANVSASSVTVVPKPSILDDVGLLSAAIVILSTFGGMIYIGAKADKKRV